MKSKEGKAGSWLLCNSSSEMLRLLALAAVCVAVLGHGSSVEVDRCCFQAVVAWWSSLEPQNLSRVDCFSLCQPLKENIF